MTAPVAPASNAAPDLSGPHSFDTLIADATNEAIQATLAEIGEEPSPTPRDDKGRFVKATEDSPTADNEAASAVADAVKSTQPAEEAAPPEKTEGEAEAPETPPALPEGLAAVPKVDRPLATQFVIRDKDGELEIPEVEITFTANGKERTEPLDKVVKLAQFGVYNHEKEQAMQAKEAEARQIAQQNAELIAYVQQVEAEVEKMLGDADHYLSARDQFEASNTPEARAERKMQEVQQREEAFTAQQWAMQGEQFFSGRVQPALEQIAAALPTVGIEELGARVLLAVDRHRVQTKYGTMIPPTAYQAVQEAVLRDVVPWAQQVHEHRAASLPKPAPKADTAPAKTEESAKVQKAQIEAQKAKNLVAKAVKPMRPADTATGKESKPPRAIRNVDDAMASAVADTMAAMGMG